MGHKIYLINEFTFEEVAFRHAVARFQEPLRNQRDSMTEKERRAVRIPKLKHF